jgi:hypothetical protein
MKLLGKIGKVIGPVEMLLNEAIMFVEKFEIQSRKPQAPGKSTGCAET